MKTFIFSGDVETLKSNENEVMVTTINKSDAKKMLACSIGNRHERLDNIQNLTRSMNNGEYSTKVAGSGIAFDEDGNLINGHHQLKAFLQSRLEVLNIRIELGSDSGEHCDEGVTRSVKDSLYMSGKISKEWADKYPQIVKNIFHIMNGRVPTNVGARKEYSKEDYIKFINENSDELKHLSYLDGIYSKSMHRFTCDKLETKVRLAIAFHLIYQRGYSEESVFNYLYGILSLNEQPNTTVENLRTIILKLVTSKDIQKKTPGEFYDVVMAGFFYYYHTKNGMKSWACIYKNAGEAINKLNPVGSFKFKGYQEVS